MVVHKRFSQNIYFGNCRAEQLRDHYTGKMTLWKMGVVFSSEVKEELAKQSERTEHCQIAELAGILELEGMLDEEGEAL